MYYIVYTLSILTDKYIDIIKLNIFKNNKIIVNCKHIYYNKLINYISDFIFFLHL